MGITMNNMNNNEQKKKQRGVQLHPLHPSRSAPVTVNKNAALAKGGMFKHMTSSTPLEYAPAS